MRRSFFLSPVRCSCVSKDLFWCVRASPSLGCYASSQEVLRDGDMHRTMQHRSMLDEVLRNLSLRCLELASAQFQDVLRLTASLLKSDGAREAHLYLGRLTLLLKGFASFRNGSVLCASLLERATRCCLQTLVVFGCLSSVCFLRTPDTSRVPTETREHEARERSNFSAPRLWRKC